MDSPESEYNQQNFEVSEFFGIDEWVEEEDRPSSMDSGYSQNPVYAPRDIGGAAATATGSSRRSGIGKKKKEVKEKVAFKTKSEVEILDDGFKWRKYGKKKVKNSPNPRNYYKCSVEDCHVKKRVERDGEDPRYIITTYEGLHNHQAPSI